MSLICKAGHLEGLDLLLGLEKTVLSVDAANGYVIALFGKLDCNGLADAPGGPGDQYCFTWHKTHILSVIHCIYILSHPMDNCKKLNCNM